MTDFNNEFKELVRLNSRTYANGQRGIIAAIIVVAVLLVVTIASNWVV